MKAAIKSRPKAKAAAKLTGDERRAAIVVAVRRVFADKGFHGTTTRELAEAAGVSEALLFKHFPNKEALYSAMLVSCSQQQGGGAIERLKALEPSASTLVVLVHLLVSHVLAVRSLEEDDTSVQTRLMLHSMLEDGEFARLRLRQLFAGRHRGRRRCRRAVAGESRRLVRASPGRRGADPSAPHGRRRRLRVFARTIGRTGCLVRIARNRANRRSDQALLQPAGASTFQRMIFWPRGE